jgi:hypothetical protein
MDVELETIPNQTGTAVLGKADGKILKVSMYTYSFDNLV